VELWKSDGTIAGTVLAADIWPGDAWSFSWPKYLTPVAGTLYFSADDGVHGRELCAVHGATTGVGGVAGAGALSTLRLLPAAPNPFRGVTALRFDLDAPAAVRVQIFDVAGHLVREILPGDRLAAGRHAIDWDGRNASGRDLASGVYVYQVESAARREVGRVVLTR
jgi:ELWxxDGT repeat protein